MYEVISMVNFVEVVRIDFQKWNTTYGQCPPPPTQVYIYQIGAPLPPVLVSNVLGLRAGIYYRMSISATTTADNQPVPKYNAQLVKPYFGVVYPAGDVHAGKMIVKVTEALNTIPYDVETLDQTEVQAELKRILNSEIAL